jgi:bla regulator protein BlaR1
METLTLEQFMAALGRNSLQAAVLVLAVLLAQWLSGQRLAPRWRCAFWLLVVVRLLVPFSFGSATSVFNLMPHFTKSSPAQALSIQTSHPLPEIKSAPAAPVQVTEPLMNSQPPELIATPAPPTIVRVVSPATPLPSVTATKTLPHIEPVAPISWSWPVCFFWVWLAGVTILLGHVLISSVRLARRCAGLRPLTGSATLAVLESCRAQLALRTSLVIVESPDVSSPALHGILRPRLLLPGGFTAKFSAEELRFVFLHELAHLKRRDLWMNWIMALLQAVHWFNPLVWLAFARWRDDRELACDAMVLEAAGAERNKEYGRIILRLLENFMNPLRTPGLVGILEDKRQLRRRIGMIANYSPSPRWSLLPVVLIAALTLLGLTDARSNDSADGAPVSASAGKAGFQLTIDLRDGSRVVGRMPDDTLNFHADALGDIKLAWADIRSIEYNTSTNTARLTTTSGDAFTGQIKADILHLETGFGKTEIAVGLIRSVKVSVTATPNIPAPPIAAAAADTNQPLPRLTVELRDGSQVIGTSVVKFFKFRSALLGELKLGVNDIRSAECVSSNSVKLTVANGDTLMVAFADSGFTVMTSFGKADLTVDSVRKFSVSAGGNGAHPPGLVALWSGEGDGIDSIGGNNATLTDITFAPGKVGQAFSFNGLSSSIRIPASQSLDIGEGDGFTITAWIKPSDVQGLHPLIQWTDNNMLNLWIGIRPFENGVLRGDITDAAGNHFLATNPGTLASGVFQHIAFTYDKASGIGTLYLNGVIVAQRQLGIQLVANTKGDLLFSQLDDRPGNWSTNRAFAGLMDEIALYNRALSASEIQAMCTDENHGEPLTSPNSSTGWFESWMR